MNPDVRWIQRFDNFGKAYNLLDEACSRGIDSLTQLEQEGVVQRFKLAFELAWKTMRDYMTYNGLEVPAAPRPVIKEAFASGLIDDGQVWIDMMLHLNLLAHTYDVSTFEKLLHSVESTYLVAIRDLYNTLLHKKPGS